MSYFTSLYIFFRVLNTNTGQIEIISIANILPVVSIGNNFLYVKNSE